MKKKILFLLLSAACLFSYGQPGSLDPTFGTAGITTTSFGATSAVSKSMAIQTDGKIVMAGYHFNGSIETFALARYNTNGSLDNTFDGDGRLTTVVGTSNSRANSIAIQPDGKIVVAGVARNSNNDFALARYNTNGSLDVTFDGDGIVTTAIGTSADEANSIVIQTDGKIVVAGSSFIGGSTWDFALARYNTDGSLDITFDGDGKLTTAIGTSDDFAYSIVLQTDGKIVVGGNSDIGGNLDFSLARYNTDGSLDNTFDGDGKLTVSIGFATNAAAVVIQTDGKILITGGTGSDFALARYNTNGSLDNSFNGTGIVQTPVGTSNSAAASSIAIQTDGKIVAAGTAFVTGNGRDFALVRYNPNGTLDNTFDGDGKVTTHINGNDFGNATKISGLRIYVGGLSNDNVFALAAYLNSGALPVQLISFTAHKQNKSIVLNWKTAFEQNSNYFGIERSNDGSNFGSIGNKAAAGNSQIARYYSFIDGAPNTGINLYRLKQTDLDGKFTYSPVLIIRNDVSELIFSLSPNPATDFINIVYTGNKDRVFITIYDAGGKLVKQQTAKNGLPITVQIQELKSGMYFIQLSDGEIIRNAKFVK